MRNIILASCLALVACGTTGTSQPARQEPAATPAERMRFLVDSMAVYEDDSRAWVLQPLEGDSTIELHPDSLSLSVRPGMIVRRCHHATGDHRGYVTFCIDHAATRRMEPRT